MSFLDERLPDRFWDKVIPEPNSGCWIWIASALAEGYGKIKIAGRTLYAYRVAYEALVAPIPDGLTIDHRCQTPSCCNPAHLEPVSLETNSLRGKGRLVIQARRRERTHCKRGHEYSEGNTYEWRGVRICRECKNERERQQCATRGENL